MEVVKTEHSLKMSKPADIEEAILRMFEYQTKLSLSQYGDTYTSKGEAEVAFYNPFSREIVLRPEEGQIFKFKKKHAIIIKTQNGSMAFKTQIEKVPRNRFIVVPFPEEIILMTKRKHQRKFFDRFDLSVMFRNYSEIDYQRKYIALNANLIDLSAGGIGFAVTEEEAKKHHVGDKIIISLINGYSLAQKISGRLLRKNINRDEKGETLVHLAMAFDREIPVQYIYRYLEGEILLKGRKLAQG